MCKISNEGYYSTKHNYKLKQIRICNHLTAPLSIKIRGQEAPLIWSGGLTACRLSVAPQKEYHSIWQNAMAYQARHFPRSMSIGSVDISCPQLTYWLAYRLIYWRGLDLTGSGTGNLWMGVGREIFFLPLWNCIWKIFQFKRKFSRDVTRNEKLFPNLFGIDRAKSACVFCTGAFVFTISFVGSGHRQSRDPK